MAREMKDSGGQWIGAIPVTWEMERLKYVVSYNDEVLGEAEDDGYEFDYIDISSVEYGKGITNLQHFRYKDAPSRARRVVRADDVIVSTVRTYLKAIATIGESEQPLIASTGFIVLRAKKHKMLPQFLKYAVLSHAFISMVEAKSTGISYPAINASEVVNISIPIPPLFEQNHIAKYLETECARIDTVIDRTRASIDEYKKLKQSIITQAVTKGIRPNRKMKDSGIEWIGEIPNEWDVLPFTKSICSIVDYRGKTPEKQDEGTLLITARNIKGGKIDYECSREYVRTEDYDDIMHRGKVEIGDVLFTTEAPLGAVANADRTDFALAQRIVKFKGTPDILNNYYLKYWIMSDGFQQNLATFSTGSTAKGIKTSKFCMLKQVLPPVQEQEEIVEFLNQKLVLFDEMIDKKEKLIVELESYKKSIIYGYVTGKKEVV